MRPLLPGLFFALVLVGGCSTEPQPGDACTVDDQCGFAGECDGDSCKTNCPCYAPWVCRKARPSDPFAKEFCYLPCDEGEETVCPGSWECRFDSDYCEYDP